MTNKAPELKPCPVAEAIIEHWGERCPDFEQGCPCCDAWSEYDRLTADLRVKVKPLEWAKGTPIAKPLPYQIWSNNGGSGAPDDPYVEYENFMALDPFMNDLGEFELYEDAEQACEEHWQAFMTGNIKPAPMTQAQGWQPIETAPKDGSWFVAARFQCDQEPEYEVGQYDPILSRRFVERPDGLFEAHDDQIFDWRGFNSFHRATHWMPLPKPPIAEGESDNG